MGNKTYHLGERSDHSKSDVTDIDLSLRRVSSAPGTQTKKKKFHSLTFLTTSKASTHRPALLGATGQSNPSESAEKHEQLPDEIKENESQEKPKEKEENSVCPICLEQITNPKELDRCGHRFCLECIDSYFERKPQCPCCFTIYGDLRGDQPEDGQMFTIETPHRLPGYEDSDGTIEIYYQFPSGIQDERHPSPGKPYKGTTRRAFLPNNPEGRHVLDLLKRAFSLRQIFTIGESRTTGASDVVTWNDIHHKTDYRGGPQRFGYPDPNYLNRVQQELAAKGIQ